MSDMLLFSPASLLTIGSNPVPIAYETHLRAAVYPMRCNLHGITGMWRGQEYRNEKGMRKPRSFDAEVSRTSQESGPSERKAIFLRLPWYPHWSMLISGIYWRIKIKIRAVYRDGWFSKVRVESDRWERESEYVKTYWDLSNEHTTSGARKKKYEHCKNSVLLWQPYNIVKWRCIVMTAILAQLLG